MNTELTTTTTEEGPKVEFQKKVVARQAARQAAKKAEAAKAEATPAVKPAPQKKAAKAPAPVASGRYFEGAPAEHFLLVDIRGNVQPFTLKGDTEPRFSVLGGNGVDELRAKLSRLPVYAKGGMFVVVVENDSAKVEKALNTRAWARPGWDKLTTKVHSKQAGGWANVLPRDQKQAEALKVMDAERVALTAARFPSK